MPSSKKKPGIPVKPPPSGKRQALLVNETLVKLPWSVSIHNDAWIVVLVCGSMMKKKMVQSIKVSTDKEPCYRDRPILFLIGRFCYLVSWNSCTIVLIGGRQAQFGD